MFNCGVFFGGKLNSEGETVVPMATQQKSRSYVKGVHTYYILFGHFWSAAVLREAEKIRRRLPMKYVAIKLFTNTQYHMIRFVSDTFLSGPDLPNNSTLQTPCKTHIISIGIQTFF